jgi:hypothetical protein
MAVTTLNVVADSCAPRKPLLIPGFLISSPPRLAASRQFGLRFGRWLLAAGRQP